jgi:hypothetical protein
MIEQSGAAERRHRRHRHHRRDQCTATSYGIVAINGASTLLPIPTPTFTVSAGNTTDLNVHAASVFGELLRHRHNAYHHQPAGAGRHRRDRCHFGRRPDDSAQRTTGNASGRKTNFAVGGTPASSTMARCGVMKLGNLGNQMTNSGLLAYRRTTS